MIICLGTVGLFKLYEDPGGTEFWITLAFAEAVCLLTVLWVIVKGWFVVPAADRAGSAASATRSRRSRHGARV